MKNLNFKKIAFTFVLVFSLSGLFASFMLTVDKIEILENPDFVPECNINPLFSCTNVMNTPYAELLGFPNSIIGLIGYAVMATVAVLMLFEGKVNKLFMVLANIGALGAFIFSYYLMWVSVYEIESLCIYCLLSCFSATNLFFALTLSNLKEGVFNLSKDFNNRVQYFIAKGLYAPVILIWHIFIIFLIVKQYPQILSF